MADTKNQVKKLMKAVREKGVPPSEVIVNETLKELNFTTGDLSSDTAQENFNDILRDVFNKTLEVLERYEDQAYGRLMIEMLIKQRTEDVVEACKILGNYRNSEEGLKEVLTFLFARWYPYLRQMFLSISQSRKARGGKDFELQIGALLDIIDVPFQKEKRAHRVDFMVPSDEAYATDRNKALIISAKRTLRERWREVVEELYDMRSPNVYLVTADENISSGHVQAICHEYNIHLVVWDDVKATKFSGENLVISYSALANNVIPHFKQLWNLD